jgi:Rrf2 family protein
MLTQTAKYALKALIHLTQQPDDDYHQTREVARIIHVPANYLGKTLQKLARAKIVDSQKGLHGGFRSARLPEQVRVYDVLAAIEAIPHELEAPLPKESKDETELDSLQRKVSSINMLYAKFLKETTLADVMHPEQAIAEESEKAEKDEADASKGDRFTVLSI